MNPGADHLVARAQAGDPDARESLLRDYQPFVLRVVARMRGRFVTASSEEASVALVAFNEAIDSYRPGQGVGFLSFSETVIRRRLIDHFRRQVRGAREVPLSALEEEDEEGGTYSPVEVEAARAAHQAYVESWERREEVMRFGARLRELGLTLDDLVRVSPRHRDARQRALRAARYLADRPGLGRQVLARGELPMRELEANLGLGRKMLERNRKYILALTLVLMEDFPYLQDYLRDGLGP
ncbi:MAG: RNA polymerase sigma-I factor [Bacillota bacterium]